MKLEEVISLITTSYGGDLSSPHFYFVDPAMDRRPYDPEIGLIGAIDGVEIREYSDANTYSSFACLISHGGQEWALELSMLGPIGAFARLGKHYWHRLLLPDDQDLQLLERRIFGILAEQKITVGHESGLRRSRERACLPRTLLGRRLPPVAGLSVVSRASTARDLLIEWAYREMLEGAAELARRTSLSSLLIPTAATLLIPTTPSSPVRWNCVPMTR
ncbi:hypothetical protein UA75_03625 [Actinoalloteichus sp. GBA129-24]|uniref:Uncharacterized protein n=1 Tax=Actinoalloteichus fjordicus TaxID=1612552 RepID=A0AAC9PQE2_9PSEU|nr:hypothetical protein UA74_03525 [Actinoalloteichus fjordicus]APU18758.1 hypothetical protein UA75_03625 [Actinoalloteichus sp. GBA129-24]